MQTLSFLFSERQLRILKLVLADSAKTFSLSEIARAAGPGHGATQRYVQRLVASNMLLVETMGKQRRYRANAFHSVYQQLRVICDKADMVD